MVWLRFCKLYTRKLHAYVWKFFSLHPNPIQENVDAAEIAFLKYYNEGLITIVGQLTKPLGSQKPQFSLCPQTPA